MFGNIKIETRPLTLRIFLSALSITLALLIGAVVLHSWFLFGCGIYCIGMLSHTVIRSIQNKRRQVSHHLGVDGGWQIVDHCPCGSDCSGHPAGTFRMTADGWTKAEESG